MEAEKQIAQQFRKSIYAIQHNPQHKKFILDIISQKIGSQNLAIILVIIASITFPLGFLYANENNMNPFQLSLMRGTLTIVVNFFIAYHYNIELDFQNPHNFRTLLKRNMIMALQGIVLAIIQFFLTQPIINTLTNTGPLFIFLLDYKINGITITRSQFWGVIFGVVGVIMTVNGDFVIHLINPEYKTRTDFKNYTTDDPVIKLIGATVYVAVQFLWAYGQIITKTLHSVNSIQINYHLGICVILTAAMFYPQQVSHPVPLETFFSSFIFSGILMVISQLFFIGGITMSKNTGVLTMFGFISVVVAYIVSVVKYNETLNPFCTAGTILIVIGLAKIVLKKKEDNAQKSNQVQLTQNLKK